MDWFLYYGMAAVTVGVVLCAAGLLVSERKSASWADGTAAISLALTAFAVMIPPFLIGFWLLIGWWIVPASIPAAAVAFWLLRDNPSPSGGGFHAVR